MGPVGTGSYLAPGQELWVNANLCLQVSVNMQLIMMVMVIQVRYFCSICDIVCKLKNVYS
jgi:hypothetical protein